MGYYNIDSADGNSITQGIQSEGEARRIAQRMANERGVSVYLYEVGGAGDGGESEIESEEIEPEADEAEHTPADAIAICRDLHVRLVASDIDSGCVSAEPVPPKAARLLCERLDAIGVLTSRAEHEDRDGNRDGRVWVYVAIDPEIVDDAERIAPRTKADAGTWETVAAYTATFPHDTASGEGSCEVSVQVAQLLGGGESWVIRTSDDAGGSDECDGAIYGSRAAAVEAAEAFADAKDEAL